MPIGEPTMPTPEEQAKIEKERTISDAELLKGGAEYVVDENGEKRLEATANQINSEHDHFESDQRSKEEHQKDEESKTFFYQVVTECVFDDLREFLESKKQFQLTAYINGHGTDNFIGDMKDLMQRLAEKFRDKVRNGEYSEIVKKRLLGQSHPEGDNIFTNAACLRGYLWSIAHRDLADKVK